MNRQQQGANPPGKVIAAVNRKGGVGKTSIVFHLAGCFAENGQRVLLIDADPQHSLTTGLFGPHAAEQIPPDETVAALFDDSCFPAPENVIRATPLPGIEVVCGSDALTRFNLPDPRTAGALCVALRDFVEAIRTRYDLVLIDNPPNIQLCSWASLAAADFALVVSQAEDYGSQGCVAVQRAIGDVVRDVNGDLQLAGYVLNMVDRRLSVHRAYDQLLRESYGDKVFRTKVPLLTHFKEAIAARRPVTMYKPNSIAAQAVRELTSELFERIYGSAGLANDIERAGEHRRLSTADIRQPETV